ncbi:NAD(P)-dependent oxidoreductase [Desulforhopalus singaporensis]|uniref:Saccharopine dehydrogenase [NAD(+), L-lysine-forming] n=1 Tax=Desulforhopalus singaporensis TaxID=91360 RepID=A0A1H0RWQ2_9BACT|nr:NAD(P)-dependent oxidoreductase [Desulforhopalus singaporensis]SDP33785.1 Alanine dehydrogenase [Desulforhopalus singaporensis]
MSQVKIGLIREGKVPVDRRVALPPSHARKVAELYPGVELVVQKSDIRCYPDDAYVNAGIPVVDSLEDCDIIFGVKEVPVDQLLPGKTYFFFSHTIKKQPYNRKLLQEVLRRNIRLVDYETLTDKTGKRIIAFGRWAGIVGAYNGIWTYGRRYNLFHTRRAYDCFDLEDLKTEFAKIKLPPIKIVLTGGGRVAKGAMEVLMGIGIRKVTPRQLLEKTFDYPVFALLNARDYNGRKDKEEFSRNEFYRTPQLYDGCFLQYAREADILIASAYWDPKAPVLFTRKDIVKNDFKITVIADITCDIDGSIPSTRQPSTIEQPIYDYNPSDDAVENPLSDEGNITVMAVDNLPCELARDASASFGRQLMDNVLPELLGNDENGVVERATIAENGELTKRYRYLQDYVGTNP